MFVRRLPGETFSDALLCSYAMATDASKWDTAMLLALCNDQNFEPVDVTFICADSLLKSISDIVKVVCDKYMTSCDAIPHHLTSYDRNLNPNLLASETSRSGREILSSCLSTSIC